MPWVLAHPAQVRTLTVVNSWMWSFEDDRVMRRRASMVSGRVGRLLYRRANASLRLIMPSAYANRRRLTPAIHRQYREVFPDPDSRERVLFTLACALLGSSAFYADLWAQRARLAQLDGRAGSATQGRAGSASPALAFIWGMRDSAFGPDILARWTEAFPTAPVTRLDDAGHWPHEEQPGAVIDAIRAILA